MLVICLNLNSHLSPFPEAYCLNKKEHNRKLGYKYWTETDADFDLFLIPRKIADFIDSLLKIGKVTEMLIVSRRKEGKIWDIYVE